MCRLVDLLLILGFHICHSFATLGGYTLCQDHKSCRQENRRDQITRAHKTHCKDGKSPQDKVPTVFVGVCAELIYKVSAAQVQKQKHHTQKELIVVE